MTPPAPSAPDRPGSPEPGTERLAFGAGGTGPVPIVGDRPAPPVRRPSGEIPVVSGPPLPDEVAELPMTEQPAGGRAGRQLRAAAGVRVGPGAGVLASL